MKRCKSMHGSTGLTHSEHGAMHYHVGRATKILYHLPAFLALGKLHLLYCDKFKILPVLASLLTGKRNHSW